MKRPLAISTIGTAGVMACVAASHAAQAPLEAISVERLKRTYLVCGHTAAVRRLMPTEVALCAEAAQALLEHGFGGDFDRLVSWWQAQRVRQQIPAQQPP
jgi:hypothetical protein